MSSHSNYLVESMGSPHATLLQRVPTRLQAKALALWDFGPQRLAAVGKCRWASVDGACRGRTHMNVLDLSRWQCGITTVYRFR